MLQESVSNEEEIFVLTRQPALVDDEVAFLMAGLIQVLFWVDLEDVVTHLETDWLHLWSDILAALLDVAEGFVGGAIEVWKSLSPLLSDLFEHIWWDGELGRTSIYDCWVGGILTWLLHSLATIVHALTLKSPGTKPVLKVLESLESLGSTNDLSRVVSSEKSIWGLSHLSGSDTETDHGSVNNLVVLQGPEVVKLLLLHVLVWGKTKNTIRIMTEALRFVEGKELEESALVVFQIDFELLRGNLILTFQWLDASVILPYETLELG